MRCHKISALEGNNTRTVIWLVIVVVWVGMVMLPMDKVLGYPRHTVGGVKIPLPLVVKHRGVGYRAIIGYGVARKLHYRPSFLGTVKVGN